MLTPEPWWLPDMRMELARIEATIADKQDDEMVWPPFGDARPRPVRTLKAWAADKRETISEWEASRVGSGSSTAADGSGV